MRILALTPLFPPDVSAPAVYAKELVGRLSEKESVTCIHYGQLPEKADQATLLSIRKDVSIITRLLGFLLALLQHRNTDTIIVMNGPSVELPYLLLSLLLPRRCIYIENDVDASTRAGVFGQFLRRLMRRRATHTVRPNDTLLTRPIIHPLDTSSEIQYRDYDAAWLHHCTDVTTLCQT